MEISNTSKTPRTTDMDRFSDLPDDVAHRVLLFLSMQDISRLSVASKRCRQLCISTPFLNLDLVPFVNNATKRARLMNFIDRFLFLRKGMDALYCCIRWQRQRQINRSDEEFRVLSWLQNAITLNVKHLVLHAIPETRTHLTLPSSTLLCSTSLKTLDLLFFNSVGILKTPSAFTIPGSPSSLNYLKLKSVRIDESFGSWISTHCKFLKHLRLEDIKGTTCINVTSSSLVNLVIASPDSLLHLHVAAEILESMCLDWRFNSPNNRGLQLSTPRLKVLRWAGNILNLSVAENLTNLHHSSIFLESCSGITSANWNLFHAIRGVCNSRFLFINYHCIQDLLNLGCPPILFTDLSALRIWITDARANLVPSLSSFLKGTPNLCLLSLGKCRIRNFADVKVEVIYCLPGGNRELQDMPFMYNLKFVKIEVIDQQNNELKLIEFLLKNAQNLKKMIILFSDCVRPDFSKEISGYEKASPDVEVNFQKI